MAWDQLDINRPHLVYIILGGFTSLFMLCSSVIKERLYIGEATIATLCGIVFGPIAANLINPLEWGNTDQITLEFSRIVLVVQCFAVGVELPKSYMERHWKSVVVLLIPVMTFGWLVTSLFIWWMFMGKLNWLESLCVSACVTATDPVLASSVVGKGKFAKRVPKHLRDLLSAESGCNDGMAFPFIYLALYLMRYHENAHEVSLHWITVTILYECIFGAVYGVMVGYFARRAIRFAHERDLIDRESFLVFYFVLALFCAGSGSLLGMDDLLIGFACGVGFSNDGWFQEKTEESHVSNVIDLLINLAFFVYFGTIIPWNEFNSAMIGTTPWRLVVVAVFVVFFRRIPIMMLLKPVIPDIKTWREALFAGHFGPIGVGALFVAILARGELETGKSTPLNPMPTDSPFQATIELIWPITCFLVVCSIVVHGSSVAVFTLGKHINTLTLTFSYTTAVEEGPNWMDRLPRIQSRSRSSMSLRRTGGSETSLDEKGGNSGLASPLDLPKNFLRRQKEEDTPLSGVREKKDKKKKRKGRKNRWDRGIGPGGPISQSAITPASRMRSSDPGRQSDPRLEAVTPQESASPDGSGSQSPPGEPQEEIYQEGSHTVIEDEEGNVIAVRKLPGDETDKERVEADQRAAARAHKKQDVEHGVAQAAHDGNASKSDRPRLPSDQEEPPPKAGSPSWWKRMEGLAANRVSQANAAHDEAALRRRGPARAYTFGNTVIVEDEDGEVIKQYSIPNSNRPASAVRRPSIGEGLTQTKTRDMLQRMGMPRRFSLAGPSKATESASPRDIIADDDEHIRFTIGEGGPRLRKEEFINQLQKLDPKTRHRVVDDQPAPEEIKNDIVRRVSVADASSSSNSADNLDRIVSAAESIPSHSVADTLAHYNFENGGRETAAQRRRRMAGKPAGAMTPPAEDESSSTESESEDDEDVISAESRKAVSAAVQHAAERSGDPPAAPVSRPQPSYIEEAETAAEKRRRQAALGMSNDDGSSSDDDDDGTGFREPRPRDSSIRDLPRSRGQASSAEGASAAGGRIRFDTEQPRVSQPRLRWGEDVGREP